MTVTLTDAQCEEAIRLAEEFGVSEAARISGVPRTTLQSRVEIARQRSIAARKNFVIPPLASEDTPIEELLERKDADWKRKQAARTDRNLININLNTDGPFGLIVFGDPHIDDPGCNWDLFRSHTQLAKDNPDILYSVLVGDLANNWVGIRLTQKWKDQTITARESEALVEWWLDELGDSIMLCVMGNHDHWARTVGGSSVLEWIMALRTGVIEPYEVNASINTPSGESFTVNMRHNYKGSSIYNKAIAGMAKQVRLSGRWPDIMLAGHIHVSQFTQMMCPSTKLITHAVRVSGYKIYDDYADREEFLNHSIYESVVLVCNPYEPDERYRVRVYDPFHGVEVLKMMRKQWADSQVEQLSRK